ncbi:MAG TPA: M1 family metallopeptidase [Rhodothermales bacterium]|nr:M1 family metallopeptidase [Rhodothermales bacterium]
MRPRLFALSLLVLAATSARAQTASFPIMDSGGPIDHERASYDVRFYDLALEVFPDARHIAGRLAVRARITSPTDVLVLDLDTVFSVSEATLAGQPVRLGRQGGRLRLPFGRTAQPGETVEATVRYEGAPRVARRAPWDGGFVWQTTPSGAPWIATAVQGDGCDLYWPCKDHPTDEPDSMAISVTVPAPLVVATNGRLRGVDEAGGKRTYRWFVHNPINSYNVALNIAPYRTVETTFTSVTGETVPAVFYVIPERYDDAVRIFPQFLDHVRWYERTVGPFPWRRDKYGVAHTPHLGMEHQSINAYGSDFGGGPDGFDWLHHHELAHEWWGNVQTAWDWRDYWLHEGTGTYMQSLYAEETRGMDGYFANIARNRRSITNRLPVAPRRFMTTDSLYNGDVYYKGALTLHTLRFLIGKEALLTALRRQVYPTPEMERAHGGSQTHFTTTDDFVALVNRIAGRDLAWFFEVYLRQAALPRLVSEPAGTELRLRWEVPGNLPFLMPVEVSIDGRTQRVEMPNGQATVRLPRAGATVIVDPQGWVLKEEPRRDARQ